MSINKLIMDFRKQVKKLIDKKKYNGKIGVLIFDKSATMDEVLRSL